MTIPLVINGSSFAYPQNGDSNWGVQATNWATAVTIGMLQRAGGAFTLTQEVDFGATYGLITAYYKSQGSNLATTGVVRLANSEVINWRNNANSGNLPLTVSSGDVLTFNGEAIAAGEIVNADIAANAAIAFSKMAPLSTAVAVITDGSGVITTSATTATQIGYLSTLTGNVQTALDAKLSLAGGTMLGALVLAADPVTAFQAATKAYVDALVTGLQPKTACRVATTANLNTATDLEDGDTVDDVTLATGDRVLVKSQSAPAQNGIYIVPASGAASRSTDMDTWTETLQAYIFVTEGTANAATGWVSQSAAGGTIGVTALPFAQFLANTAYTADGQGLELSGSQFALELDGTTLSKSGSGLKVNLIANAQIGAAAAIAVNKLAALTASRAVVSDGSGFIAAATTTATQIGYLSTTSSDVQVQLDGKINASVMTEDGDLITRASGIPARIDGGVSQSVLTMDGGTPTWVLPEVCLMAFHSSVSSYVIPTTWTVIPLGTKYEFAGPQWTVTSNVLSDGPYDGVYKVTVILSDVATSTSSGRNFAVRFRNTSTNTTLDISTYDRRTADNGNGSSVFVLYPDIPDPSENYEIQIAANGSGLAIASTTIDGVAPYTYQIFIEKVPPQTTE